MIHPLSSENEIEFYLKESGSLFAVTLDQFYHKFEAIRQNVTLDNIILASIPDALSRPVRVGYMLTEGRKQARIPKDAPVLRWHEFLRRGLAYHWRYKAEKKAQDEAVILYSGGTTGVTKGIQLTNLNFNALGAQIIATNPMFRPGDKMLAVMPMFHGFGLGEYGATSMIAGYTPGRTATISTTVYQLWQTNDDALAMKWVMVNLAISAVVLLAVNLLERRDFLVNAGRRRRG